MQNQNIVKETNTNRYSYILWKNNWRVCLRKKIIDLRKWEWDAESSAEEKLVNILHIKLIIAYNCINQI